MNWDEIEVKWAEMAQRVRSDQPNAKERTTPADDTPIVSPGDLPEPPSPAVEPSIAP